MVRRVFRPHWLFILAGLALFVAALRSVPLAETWAVLHRLGPGQIGLLVAANGVVLLTFSGRWWLILRAQGYAVPYHRLAGYRLAAFGVSYFTPGPQFGGEPLQVYLTSQREGVPVAAAVAAVALDKTLELLVNFAFLAAGLAVVLALQGRDLPALLPPTARPQAIAGAALLLALPIAALSALWAGRHPLTAPMAVLARRARRGRAGLARLAGVLHEAEAQVTAFCRGAPAALAAALAVSVVSWAALIGEYWLALWLLGAQPSIWQMVAALTAMRLALLVPLPGGLGALEASQALAFVALGFSPALGVALSLLIRARDIALGAAGLGLASALGTAGFRRHVMPANKSDDSMLRGQEVMMKQNTTARFGPLQLGIIALTLATALIHFTLVFPSPLFILNGLGYLALLAALYAPVSALAPYRSLARWALLGYTALTVILWLAIGLRAPIGYINKAIEVALIALLLLEGQRR